MVLGDAASKSEMFVWIFNYVLKSVTWSLFDLKASHLDRWPISKYCYLSCDGLNNYQLVHPSSLRNSEMAYKEMIVAFQ